MSGMIAARNYSPGDLIYSEKSFAKVLQTKLKDIACESCGTRPLSLKTCKQCLAVKYCGKSCQRKDWSSHQLECKNLKNLSGDNTDLVRLIGKVIFKIKDKNWKDIKQQVFGKECTFDDIFSHQEEFSDRRLNLLFKEFKELTLNFIGSENMPEDEDFMKIMGKVLFNVLSTRELCLFIGVSAFEKACIPNTNVVFDGDELMIFANKWIRGGVDKILLPSREILLANIWLEDKKCCKCSDCSLPYKDSMLSKIINEEKAYSVILETETFLQVADLLPNLCEKTGVEVVVDHLLQKQEGVLGDTNYLRLRLLAFKCLKIGGSPRLIKRPLKVLEKNMRSVFGEFYIEMLPIYDSLSMIHFHLGDPIGGIRYLQKASRISGMVLHR